MKKNSYSIEIANIVKKYLYDDGCNYSFDEEHGIFKFSNRIKSEINEIVYHIYIGEDDMILYGFCPIKADCQNENMMMRMSEFICRANSDLCNGCFEFDFNSGNVNYRCYIDCANVLPSTKIIENSIYYIAAIFKCYAIGITSIIFSECSGKEAINMCNKFFDEEFHGKLTTNQKHECGNNVADLITRLEKKWKSRMKIKL